MRIKVIGLGGIGSHLVTHLCRHLEASFPNEELHVTVIDGDTYEARNADRQEFPEIGNKAEITATRISKDYPGIEIEAKPHFITEENAFVMINSGDIVFMGVDNHATRKLVSAHCEALENIVLISGGNELNDGNVQVHIRKDGRELTPPITYLHPEIEHPQDRNPAEMSCEELIQSGSPQVFLTNLTAAVCMLNAFRMVSAYLAGKGDLVYSEQYFDVLTGKTDAVLRKRSAKTK
jgi:molybdopterin/thiamine biosynthesis adenylyltransferase